MKEPKSEKYTYLEEQIIFYGSYHNQIVNVLVHIVFVPVILWGMMVYLAKFNNVLPAALFTHWPLTHFKPDGATLMAACYLAYYLVLDPVVAVAFGTIILPLTANASYLASTPNGLTYGAIGFVLGWVMQIGAHQIYEGRSPALLDNAKQAFTLAPFFITLEVLFYFGYNPKLQKKVQERIKYNVGKYKMDKAQKARAQ